jgi:hypothetical protein
MTNSLGSKIAQMGYMFDTTTFGRLLDNGLPSGGFLDCQDIYITEIQKKELGNARNKQLKHKLKLIRLMYSITTIKSCCGIFNF